MKRILVGLTGLLLSAVTLLATSGSAVAQQPPTSPATLADSLTPGSTVTRQAEQKPEHALPDLTVYLVRFGQYLDPGQEFKLATVVRNQGAGTAKPVRVAIGLALPFTNVEVIEAPGFSCTVETQGGYLPGHWAICKGGQVPDDRDIWIGIKARAPQAPGEYHVIALVDPQGAVDERDESNNSDRLTLHVRNGH